MENNVLKFIQIKMIGSDIMLVCLECHAIFEEAEQWVERHGLDTPPYEVTYGCPYCGGAYVEAYKCDNCDEWITGDYIKINCDRYCEECYTVYELGYED